MNDTCPACLRRDIPPAKEVRRGDQIVHGYICRCGHRWATTRSAEMYGQTPEAPALRAA
ncbi:hypothetical protein [Streptomyces zhihengii]